MIQMLNEWLAALGNDHLLYKEDCVNGCFNITRVWDEDGQALSNGRPVRLAPQWATRRLFVCATFPYRIEISDFVKRKSVILLKKSLKSF